MNFTAKRITVLAALCALSYVVMFVGRLPITSVPFLKYDPKDVVIVIGGFLFGPLTSLIVSVVVSLVEMFTVSETGLIGFFMNVLASAAFSCPAAFLYKRYKTLTAAIGGLVTGVLLMTGVMLLWNYLITPLYMSLSREEVAKMLVPVFLPFNLIKSSLNAVLAILLYKPASLALRRAHLVEESGGGGIKSKATISLSVTLCALIVLATLVVLILVMTGVI